MTPLFTIGIPTRNRAQMLLRAVKAALEQSSDSVEVLIADNASTDETQDVVRKLGDRVRYIRHEQNLGATENFRSLVIEASGRYFSFLQDDDLIHREWVERALAAFVANPEASSYLAYLSMAPSLTSWHMPTLYGPMCRMDWMKGGVRTLEGKLLAPFSFCGAMALPPAVAYRTDWLRQSFPFWHHECDNLFECIVLAACAVHGDVLIEPWIAGIHWIHPSQMSQNYHSHYQFSRDAQKDLMAVTIEKMMSGWDDSWRGGLKNLFLEIDLSYRLPWLERFEGRSQPPVLVAVRQVLEDSIKESNGGIVPNKAKIIGLKDVARDMTPPALWKVLQGMKKRH